MDPGQGVVLTCVAFGIPTVDIGWSFNGVAVVNTSLITIYSDDFVTGGMPYTQSFLQFCGISPPQSGGYTCTATNGLLTAMAVAQLDVFGKL